jgi:hypothetical protein
MEQALEGTKIRRRRRRRRHTHRSLRRRLIAWLRSTLWSSFKVNPGASRTSTARERWQVFGFTLALIVAMITAFTVILLEDRPSQPQQLEPE